MILYSAESSVIGATEGKEEREIKRKRGGEGERGRDGEEEGKEGRSQILQDKRRNKCASRCR